MRRGAPALTFAVVLAVNLLGTGLDNSILEWASKPLLMPCLAWLLLARGPVNPAAGSRLLWGLAVATLADVALLVPATTMLLVGVGLFAVMQLCFVAAFAKTVDVWSHWRSSPWIPVGYLALWAVASVCLWDDLGDLAVPVVGYGLLLVTMAATAATVSTTAAIGGLLFLGSDLLIGLSLTGVDFTGRDVLVMTTYATAQLLLTTAHPHRTVRKGRGAGLADREV